MTDSVYSGGCLCGRVKYRVPGPGKDPCFCHCESCRRATGAPFVAWVTFAGDKFALLEGKLTEYQSSARVTRGFCDTCGTPLTYRHDGSGNEIDVTLATLDDPGSIAPEVHLWVEDKVPWIDISDSLPQYLNSRASTK